MRKIEKSAPFIAAFFVIIVWLMTYYFLSDADDRGTFGDMFGGANAAFSGLAFVGVVYAIFLQRAEMAIAKKELDRSKELVRRQQEQIDDQRLGEISRDFEATFFQLLRLLSDIVQAMDFQRVTKYGPVTTSGKDMFPVLIERLEASLRNNGENYYDEFYVKNGVEVGHYFRVLYNILDFVKRTEPKNINLYAKIVRAQMSDGEVQLLFHNCLSSHGKKLKPLVEYFSMLKHFRTTSMNALEVQLYAEYHPLAFNKDESTPAWITQLDS